MAYFVSVNIYFISPFLIGVYLVNRSVSTEVTSFMSRVLLSPIYLV